MKKAVALFLALVMCLSLAACGKTASEPETTPTLSSEEESYLTALFDGIYYHTDYQKVTICSFKEDGTCLINGITGTWVAQPLEKGESDFYTEMSLYEKYSAILNLIVTLDGDTQVLPVAITDSQNVDFLIFSHGGIWPTYKTSKSLAENPEYIDIFLNAPSEVKWEDVVIKDVISVEITPENWSEYFEITEVDGFAWPTPDAFGDIPEDYFESKFSIDYYCSTKPKYILVNQAALHFEFSANYYRLTFELDAENQRISYIGEPQYFDVWTEKVSIDSGTSRPQCICDFSYFPRNGIRPGLSDFQVLRVAGDTALTFIVLEE